MDGWLDSSIKIDRFTICKHPDKMHYMINSQEKEMEKRAREKDKKQQHNPK